MSRLVLGADRVRRKFGKLKTTLKTEVDKANHRSGRDIERIAKVLHPGDGSTRAEIEARQLPDGSTLVDFGSKAKVTEGDQGPRPFVNPTLKVTRKKSRNRVRYAVRKSVKATFGG